MASTTAYRSGGHDAKAAEGAGLEARHAGLERRGRRGAAQRVGQLGLRRERHVERELWGNDPARQNEQCRYIGIVMGTGLDSRQEEAYNMFGVTL